MSWIAVAAIGGGVAGGTLGYLSGQKGERNPYGTLNPEQVALTKALGPKLTGIAGGDYNQFLYGGQLSAPMTTGEAENVARQSRLAALYEPALRANLDPNLKTISQDFDRLVAQPSYAQLLRNDLPTALEGTRFATTEYGRLKGDLLTRLNASLLPQRYQALQDARTRQLSAIDTADRSAVQSATVQAIPRVIEDLGLTRQYSDFVQANQQYASSIDRMLNFLGISTVTERPDTRMQNMMAGIGAGASLGLQAQGAYANQQFQKGLLKKL